MKREHPHPDPLPRAGEGEEREDRWRVGDVELTSRFLLGTAGYPSPQVLRDAIVASGTQVVTVG